MYYVVVANTSDLYHRYNTVSAHYKENEVSIQHRSPCLDMILVLTYHRIIGIQWLRSSIKILRGWMKTRVNLAHVLLLMFLLGTIILASIDLFRHL